MTQPHRFSTFETLCALLITLCAFGTLTLQTSVDLGEGRSLPDALWSQARYFTNLMVLAVGLVFAATTLRRSTTPGWITALTVWIVLVGVVYHALLAATHDPEGLDITVNLFQHTLIPAGVLLFWWLFAPKHGLTYAHPALWLACPLGYVGYAMARGASDGTYPYFFLNPVKTGGIGVLAYVIGLGAVFYLSGAALVLLARRKG